MFDRVWVDCPKCGVPIEFQTKGGPCRSKEYRVHDLSQRGREGIDVLSGVNGHEVCRCGTMVEVVAHVHIDTVRVYRPDLQVNEDDG